VTGVVCYNDLTAIGAVRSIRAHALRVPEDVSVVGFDDLDLASYVDPPLTTVMQQTREMGRWAVERLVRLIKSDGTALDHGPTDVVRLSVRLIERGSTAPPGVPSR
jgi:DNA-binding LacI/PurR family transcriptional regulator